MPTQQRGPAGPHAVDGRHNPPQRSDPGTTLLFCGAVVSGLPLKQHIASSTEGALFRPSLFHRPCFTSADDPCRGSSSRHRRVGDPTAWLFSRRRCRAISATRPAALSERARFYYIEFP